MAYEPPNAPGQPECLILAGDPVIGYQIVDMIEWHWGTPQVVHDEGMAYASLIREKVGVVIADIDSDALGGLALLSFCHNRYPNIPTFAITSYHNGLRKKQARDLGGCKGFFYLEDGSVRIDMTRGLPAQILIGKMLANREIILAAGKEDEGHD